MERVKRILAPNGIHRDFEQDVLERLQKHRAAMHGCPAVSVECLIHGGVAVWFKGPREGYGGEWEGALRFKYKWLADHKVFADPEAVAEVALGLLQHIQTQATMPTVTKGAC